MPVVHTMNNILQQKLCNKVSFRKISGFKLVDFGKKSSSEEVFRNIHFVQITCSLERL